MSFFDIFIVIQWWAVFLIIGAAFLPLTFLIFFNFFDRGYIFAKIIGIVLISYTVFILGFLKTLPFTEITVVLVSFVFLIFNIFLISKYPNILISLKKSWKIFFFEEILFLGILFFWSFIHAHQPEIHGLEKYMDFGFINSILRTEYFPPKDMWFTPFSINYYYFGHLVTAVLTKLSFLPSSITFNLMLATISALSFVSAFSIGINLLFKLDARRYALYAGGLLTAFVLNFAGNLHTVYLFFKPYQNENPVPFWQLVFSPSTFPNAYWYPNATRFIENTIHEFPLYSYVVSDLHGHVLDIPFALLTIAVLLSFMFNSGNHGLVQNAKLKMQNFNSKFKIFNFEAKLLPFNFYLLTLLAFLLAIMYMTNAWDGIIYFLLSIIVLGTILFKNKTIDLQTKFKIVNSKKQKYIENILNLKSGFTIYNLLFTIFILCTGFFIFSLPFNIFFKPFTSGVGILCTPKFLTDIGNFGPFLFEANHCQRSPLWQLFLLYGFFYFWVVSFFVFIFKKHNPVIGSRFSVFGFKFIGQSVPLSDKLRTNNRIFSSDIFILILILLSTLLIIIPEFIYVKDIYPAHYRANTMFKLVYQSFIMLSISSGYIIIRVISNFKFQIGNWKLVVLVFIGSIGLLLVSVYPYFAINSYFGNLKSYQGLDGIKYLKSLYPTDYEAILWINKNIKGQPVILEAQGDSYTDYGRVSANTGLPTVLGWTVHEWLWRGTYDIPSPRITEIAKMYESQDLEETKILFKKYNVSLVFIGTLEIQKYPNLDEKKFQSLGKIIYQKGDTKIFKIHVR